MQDILNFALETNRNEEALGESLKFFKSQSEKAGELQHNISFEALKSGQFDRLSLMLSLYYPETQILELFERFPASENLVRISKEKKERPPNHQSTFSSTTPQLRFGIHYFWTTAVG